MRTSEALNSMMRRHPRSFFGERASFSDRSGEQEFLASEWRRHGERALR